MFEANYGWSLRLIDVQELASRNFKDSKWTSPEAARPNIDPQTEVDLVVRTSKKHRWKPHKCKSSTTALFARRWASSGWPARGASFGWWEPKEMCDRGFCGMKAGGR